MKKSTELQECPSCHKRTFVVSVFGSICSSCFYNPKQDNCQHVLDKNREYCQKCGIKVVEKECITLNGEKVLGIKDGKLIKDKPEKFYGEFESHGKMYEVEEIYDKVDQEVDTLQWDWEIKYAKEIPIRVMNEDNPQYVLGWNACRYLSEGFFKDLLLQEKARVIKEVIEYISHDMGWEESEDFYMSHFIKDYKKKY